MLSLAPACSCAPPSARWRTGPALLLLAAFAASAAPVALTGIPALGDYPNHLARMSILARAGTPDANPFFEPSWGLYPNLAMDLLVPPLARLIGVVEATRIFYLFTQALVVSGAAALAWTVRRSHLGAGITACMSLYCMPFAWGFINFEFGLGVALWAITTWIGHARGPHLPRLAWHAALVPALFLSHLFGLGVYGFVVVLWEVHRAVAERRGTRALGVTLVELGAPVVILGLAAVLLGGAETGASGLDRTRWEFLAKAQWLVGLNGLSLGLSCGLTFGLVMIGYAVWRNGGLRVADAGRWIAIGFGLLFVAMPFRLGGTTFVDVRVLVAAALVLPAFVAVTIGSDGWRRRAVAALAAIATINLASVAWTAIRDQREYRAMVASFERLPRHAHVLAARDTTSGASVSDDMADPLTHAPVLAIHFADAFVPTLFAAPGQHPVRPNPAGDKAARPGDAPLTTPMLAALAGGEVPADSPAYARSWQRDFGYLYVLGAGHRNPLPGLIEPMVESRTFALYRIRPQLRATLD